MTNNARAKGPLEARLRDRQARDIRASTKYRSFERAIVAVVGGDGIEVAHIGTTERDAGDGLRRHFDALVERAVGLKTHDLPGTHHDGRPDAALRIDGHPV